MSGFREGLPKEPDLRGTINPAAPSTADDSLSAKRPAMGAPIPTDKGQGVIIRPVSTWLR
jgi:hypothetical protein